MKEKNDIDVINKSLEKLISNGYITKSDAEILKLFYYEDKRNIEDINDEIAKFPINKSFLKEKLKGAKIDKEKKKVENTTPSLSLENIVDFEKDGKSFIKIHYPFPDDRVRVIENRTDPLKTAKEIFEELNESIGTDEEGIKRAVSIFEDIMLKKCNETKLVNYEEQKKYTEYDKLSNKEKESFDGLTEVLDNNKQKFEGKVVRVCLEEKIVIISTKNEPTKDEIKKIKFNKEKEKYELVPVDSKGYKYDNQDNMDQDTNSLENDASEDLDEEKELNEEEKLQKEGDFKNIDKGIAYKKRRKPKIGNN